MSEQRAPYYSDSGKPLSPKPAEETLKAIKQAIADGELADRPANQILQKIKDVLSGKESEVEKNA